MKNLSVRKIAVLGMLVALTVVLSFFATWRIGATMKISLKFVPVYVASALFGPIIGGLVAITADIASFIANPVAGFIPLITIAEFLIGVCYGLFFKNAEFGRLLVLRSLLCSAFVAVFIDGIIKTVALSLSFGNEFLPMLLSRLPAVVINFGIQLFVICIFNLYMNDFKKILTGAR